MPRFPCKQCGSEMTTSKALAQTYVGIPDSDIGGGVSTFSAGGPGELVDCLKCQDCGWSTTPLHPVG